MIDPGAPEATALELRESLRRGDVIVRAGDRPAANAAAVAAAVAEQRQAGRASIALLVHRAGRTLYVPVKLDP